MKKVIVAALIILAAVIYFHIYHQQKNDYKNIAQELLKEIDYKGKKLLIAGFPYSDGRDSNDCAMLSERLAGVMSNLGGLKVLGTSGCGIGVKPTAYSKSWPPNENDALGAGKAAGADIVLYGIGSGEFKKKI